MRHLNAPLLQKVLANKSFATHICSSSRVNNPRREEGVRYTRIEMHRICLNGYSRPAESRRAIFIQCRDPFFLCSFYFGTE